MKWIQNICPMCVQTRWEKELEKRLDTIHANHKTIPANNKEKVSSYVIEQAHHCLDSLHANEVSLENRISAFFGITAAALSALVGIVIFREPDKTLSPAQFYAALAGGALLLVAALAFLRAMQPRNNYQMKGCTPYSILNSAELIQQNTDEFSSSMLEDLERRIAKVNRQNRRLARCIKVGTGALVLAPVTATLVFFAF